MCGMGRNRSKHRCFSSKEQEHGANEEFRWTWDLDNWWQKHLRDTIKATVSWAIKTFLFPSASSPWLVKIRTFCWRGTSQSCRMQTISYNYLYLQLKSLISPQPEKTQTRYRTFSLRAASDWNTIFNGRTRASHIFPMKMSNLSPFFFLLLLIPSLPSERRFHFKTKSATTEQRETGEQPYLRLLPSDTPDPLSGI